MTNQKPFCLVCGSRHFLRHLDGCTAWQIPIIWPDPPDDLELELALEDSSYSPLPDQGLLFTLTEGAAS